MVTCCKTAKQCRVTSVWLQTTASTTTLSSTTNDLRLSTRAALTLPDRHTSSVARSTFDQVPELPWHFQTVTPVQQLVLPSIKYQGCPDTSRPWHQFSSSFYLRSSTRAALTLPDRHTSSAVRSTRQWKRLGTWARSVRPANKEFSRVSSSCQKLFIIRLLFKEMILHLGFNSHK